MITLQEYDEQVINFLKSLVIKFTPIATLQNSEIELSSTISADESTWKYYLNLSGQYHSTDTIMEIISLDTQETIDFTVNNLKNHPVTKERYIPGTTYFINLCETYPEQLDVIQGIVYPVDISTAITAPDFTILNYDALNFLETTELDSIIISLKSLIDYAVNKWYFKFFRYEPYYDISFWGLLWQNLFTRIHAVRYQNLNTERAHSYHIWSELLSNNIPDYSNLLSRKQELFLYLNMDYLNRNAGKQSNLILLIDNLLAALNIGCVGFNINQQVSDSLLWTPMVTSTIIPTNFSANITQIEPKTITEMTDILYTAKTEIDDSSDNNTKITKELALTTVNEYPTKLLILEKVNQDTKYQYLVARFTMDTLIYAISNGIYKFASVAITETTTGITIECNQNDIILLIHYCMSRLIGLTPIDIPKYYSCDTAYTSDIGTLPTTYDLNGITYIIKNFYDVSNCENIKYTTTQDPATFANSMNTIFSTMLDDIRTSRNNSDYVTDKTEIYIF